MGARSFSPYFQLETRPRSTVSNLELGFVLKLASSVEAKKCIRLPTRLVVALPAFARGTLLTDACLLMRT